MARFSQGYRRTEPLMQPTLCPNSENAQSAETSNRGPAGAPGRIADRYALRTAVGRGGMAAVYRAWDEERAEIVAIKLLYPSAVANPRHAARLALEAATMRFLAHPNLPAVYDAGKDEVSGLHYMALEYAANGSASRACRLTGPLSLDEVASWMVQVLCALAQVHACGMIHRDVKPANVLLGADGRAMLADFGVVWSPENPPDVERDRSVGTIAFMAPEQRHGMAPIRPQADIYGVGASLFSLLASDTPLGLAELGEEDARWRALPEVIRPVVFRATRSNPDDRYPDALAMARDLAPLVPAFVFATQPHLAAWLA
jgi:serine/threonine-protein kinase